MEDYFERVVDVLTGAGYRWYETANFCRSAAAAGGRDLRSRHNLAYWRGSDYLGLGIGAVSTIQGRRWRTTPRLRQYLEALAVGRRPPREVEILEREVRLRERVLLGLRLDEPLPVRGVEGALDHAAIARLERLGLAELENGAVGNGSNGDSTIALTPRGRLLGGAVTADLLT
jgi:coproporphyrinogen III oxidase-like Fe-S oxidoreductase